MANIRSESDTTPFAPDARWLTRILRENSCLQTAQVTSIVAERIGAEIGFLDSVVRWRLTYDRGEASAPKSVVVKVSSSEACYRRIGELYNAYEREFQFYEQIAPDAPIRLPRCYARELTADGAHLLVLEDLAALTPGDQVAGLSASQAEAAIEALARFQAHWWSVPQLASLAWMPTRNILPSRYSAAWPRFRESFAGRLPAAAMARGEQLFAGLETMLALLERGPQTIAHSDFRADNLLFDPESAEHPVVILDWQLAIRGPGVLDVARLVGGSLRPPVRAAAEESLVRRWHETLAANGVRQYSWRQACDDYRLAARICLYYPVTIHEAEEAAGRRGTALAAAQIERFFAAAADDDGPPAR